VFFMEEQLKQLIDALDRRNGRATQGPQSLLGVGSGVPRPKDLDSADIAVQRDARHTYVTEMTDRVPLSQLSPSERAEYIKCTQDVLIADGFYVG
jgi:hypothetical protein